MPWWQILILIYFIPTPFTQIATFAVAAVLWEEWQDRRSKREQRRRLAREQQ